MRDAQHSLRRVPIAYKFALPSTALRRQEIDRQRRPLPPATLRTPRSRDLHLPRTRTPSECAAYIRRHRHELTPHVNPSYIAAIEIHALLESNELHLAEQRSITLPDAAPPSQTANGSHAWSPTPAMKTPRPHANGTSCRQTLYT